MQLDASFFALVALIIFLGGMIYLKVPGMIAGALDQRANKISEELADARRLREEAQQLLAEYQRMRKEAEREAESIVAAAEHEAKTFAADASRKIEEYLTRRTAMAEQKIAQAEEQALQDVKSSAVDLAIAATENILAAKLTGKVSDDFFTKSIAELKSRLN